MEMCNNELRDQEIPWQNLCTAAEVYAKIIIQIKCVRYLHTHTQRSPGLYQNVCFFLVKQDSCCPLYTQAYASVFMTFRVKGQPICIIALIFHFSLFSSIFNASKLLINCLNRKPSAINRGVRPGKLGGRIHYRAKL